MATTPEYCDIVMKGGITSGVIYPGTIAAIARRYRLKGLGGASAGAIGAAFGAAAEFGREHGAFDELEGIPEEIDLGRLFRTTRRTRGLLAVLNAFTGAAPWGRSGWLRVPVIVVTLLAVFPVSSILGLALGVATAVQSAGNGWVLAGGVALAVLGWVLAMVLRLLFALTQSVPRTMFGICTGHGTPDAPQLTDWMAERLDALAHLPAGAGPLTFGQLWTKSPRSRLVADPEDREIDLRMVSTSLSQAMPVELPLMAGEWYYDPAEWALLFPDDVMAALERAPHRRRSGRSLEEYEARLERAASHEPPLRRLPDPEYLPVVVATRMSLSFPLLISAVPMWAIEYLPAERPSEFRKVWFTDGGLASNFPIHLFDRPLPTRPTFAINLGSYDREEERDPARVPFRFARTNGEMILSPFRGIPGSGFGAVAGFASAAFSTARNWRDNAHVSAPGYRDRIVQVLQSRDEGGLNLTMPRETVEALSERGRAAAEALLDQFAEPRYRDSRGRVTVTGWENHLWVRYRALLAGMPRFLRGYAGGLEAEPPRRDTAAYHLGPASQSLVQRIDELITEADATATDAPAAVRAVESEPAPRTVIRRVPDV
ncbi:patatin-like phospholipase family protein [Antiquaquibacter soli]|uniref:Patatin-like phospholipase family protein n=1 Tax=Antiquaquibacter soli TaxID=3064523 RepID=A0ABT9BK09_9MICO|nr:patatin-like phospholipase family protein [Protaetiibacter sp. WY-16]MDO7881355.1 patatin-like phospholipase family protein [Protaetiibacter sp. WY-16]